MMKPQFITAAALILASAVQAPAQDKAKPTREQAIAEMTTGGYGFHSVWTNLVDYLRAVDVAHLRVALCRRQQQDL